MCVHGVCDLQRFSMEGLSNILQTGIRQTFGSTGNDKQVNVQMFNLIVKYLNGIHNSFFHNCIIETKICCVLRWPTATGNTLCPIEGQGLICMDVTLATALLLTLCL